MYLVPVYRYCSKTQGGAGRDRAGDPNDRTHHTALEQADVTHTDGTKDRTLYWYQYHCNMHSPSRVLYSMPG